MHVYMYECMYVCTYVRMHLCIHLYVCNYICDWIFEKPIEMSHLTYSYFILFAQLIATLIHYPCTVALPGFADWSSFLEWVLSTA